MLFYNEVWYMYGFCFSEGLWRGRCCIFAEGASVTNNLHFDRYTLLPAAAFMILLVSYKQPMCYFRLWFFISFKYIKLSFLSIWYAAASWRPSQTGSRRHTIKVRAVYFNLAHFIYSVQKSTELHLANAFGQLLWKPELCSSPPAPNLVTFSRQLSHGCTANSIWNKTN